MRRVVGSSKVFNKQKASSTVWYTNNDDCDSTAPVARETTPNSWGATTLPHAATAFTALSHMDKDQSDISLDHQHHQQTPHHHYHLLGSRARWLLGLQSTDPTESKNFMGGTMSVEKVRHWKDIYKRKVAKVNRLLDNERRALQEKTDEFLNISKEADVSQTARIRSVYEKKTKKSTGAIRSLQLKLNAYQSKLKQLELLEEENNKRIRNRCGSVDNINAKLEVPKERSAKKVSVTMPRNTRYRSAELLHQNEEQQVKKFTPGEKKAADLLDGSAVSGRAFLLSAGSDEEYEEDGMMAGFEPTAGELAALISSVDAAYAMHKELEDVVQDLQERVKQNGEEWRGLLEESRYHGEHLEEQINDMMELYQHEVLNLKQELSSLEEKLEYQMDERTRDLQDLVDACQTKITKLELQQQQSISMESLDGFSMKMFATKLANILLSFFAVGLISLSVIISFFKTFFQSRFMCLLSCCILILSMYLWHSFNYIRQTETDELEDNVNYTN